MSTCNLSSLLFQYLSHLFGSEKAVQVRRIFYSLDDYFNISYPYRPVNSGSKAEGLDFPGSDLDIMLIYTKEVVYPDIISCPNNNSSSMYISTHDAPPGFAHINVCIKTTEKAIKLKYQMGFTHRIIYAKNGDKLENIWFKNLVFSTQYLAKQHGPCISTHDDTHDFMFAFQLYCWPNVASCWISRPRLFDWPPSSLISNILHESVLLVPIGSKFGSLTDNINEWRISFSLAEKLLVHSFNHTQLMCYALLKILLNEILNKNEVTKNLLCSYFMKTILFWTIEETGSAVWTPDNLAKSFRSCIKKLLYWLRQKILPNFFIPENNMIEGKLSEYSLSKLCTVLDLVNDEGINFTVRTETLHTFLTTMNNKMFIGCHDDESSVLCALVNWKRPFFNSSLTTICRLLKIFKNKLIRDVLYVFLVDDMSSSAMQLYYNLNTSNKRLYCNYKNLLGYSLIGSKKGLLSWSIVAIVFYSHKHYINTLRITDFIHSENLSIKRFFSNKNNISTMREKVKFLHKLKLLSGLLKGRTYIVPSSDAVMSETDLLCRQQLTESSFSATQLHLRFTRFMCFHHLKNFRDRRIVLHDMLQLFDEINEDRIHLISDSIFAIRACRISHERFPDSFVSKVMALGETGFNFFKTKVGKENLKDLCRNPSTFDYINALCKYMNVI